MLVAKPLLGIISRWKPNLLCKYEVLTLPELWLKFASRSSCSLSSANLLSQHVKKHVHRKYYGSRFYPNPFVSVYQLDYQHKRTLTDLSLSPPLSWDHYLKASDPDTEAVMVSDMLVFEDFLSVEEEDSLFQEIEPYMKRLRYEFDHWDNAIHGYRETERRRWSPENEVVLNRVRQLAFPPSVSQLAYVHILDLAKEGCIKPHIDSVRFCGDTIAGLCLLSPCVMHLVHDKNKSCYADVLLQRRSLYIMRNKARYEYTHEVLGQSVTVQWERNRQGSQNISHM